MVAISQSRSGIRPLPPLRLRRRSSTNRTWSRSAECSAFPFTIGRLLSLATKENHILVRVHAPLQNGHFVLVIEGKTYVIHCPEKSDPFRLLASATQVRSCYGVDGWNISDRNGYPLDRSWLGFLQQHL